MIILLSILIISILAIIAGSLLLCFEATLFLAPFAITIMFISSVSAFASLIGVLTVWNGK